MESVLDNLPKGKFILQSVANPELYLSRAPKEPSTVMAMEEDYLFWGIYGCWVWETNPDLATAVTADDVCYYDGIRGAVEEGIVKPCEIKSN